MKPGYILLEILIALALGAFIGTAVFTSYYQANMAYKQANRTVDFDSRACIVQHQFERDISGAFVPFVVESQKQTTTAVRVKATTKKGTATAQAAKKETEQKEKPLEKAFFSKNDGKSFSLLTCVTSNPLTVYGKPHPRVARVVYYLIPEKVRRGQPESFRLMRDEPKKLEFQEPREGTTSGHELARGIKELSVEYTVRPVEKKEKEKKDAGKAAQKKPETKKQTSVEKKEKKKPDYKTFPVWSKNQIKEANRNIPQFVTMKISLWDQQKKRTRKFTFKTAIVADDIAPEPKKKTETKPEPKKGQQNKQQPKKGGAQNKAAQVVQNKVAQEMRARRDAQTARARTRRQPRRTARRGKNLPAEGSVRVASAGRRRR